MFDVGLQGSSQEVVICGLAAGCYAIYTYAWAPDHPEFLTRVSVRGAESGAQMVGGAWLATHALGTTFARHQRHISRGEVLQIALRAERGNGSFNGLQIVPIACARDSSHLR